MVQPLYTKQNPQGLQSVVKIMGGLGFRLGKDILGFFKNINLDNS